MLVDAFSPISLDALNKKAQMMTRLDNKYVLPIAVFNALVPEFAAQFDMLEINGQRSFGYRTCYFDSPSLCSYRHHVQGRRHRSKVRVRHYLDANLCFLEVKLKTARNITVKKRQPHDPSVLQIITPAALKFIEECHVKQYSRPILTKYSPVMKMQYDRLTLVAHDGGERVTIDRGLQFWCDRAASEIAQDVVILETKSSFGRGLSDQILRRAGHHPVGSCSKYCVGLAALGLVPRFNKFIPALRRLMPDTVAHQSALPEVTQAATSNFTKPKRSTAA